MKTFKELGLNKDLMDSLDDLGFTEPSPIQAKAIPFILENKQDLIALAQTGTGKTAAFSLPILNQIHSGKRGLQAIILCPTRELCLQISQDIKKFIKHSRDISVAAVYGGESITLQIRSLKNGVNIVVGTPGRVNDLIRRRVLKLQSIEWLVLDEADEMLDMGFKKDLDTILQETPKTRQTLLFSATMSKSVEAISKNYMNETHQISMGDKNVGADNVTHEYYITQPGNRFESLRRILDNLPNVYGIIFCRTKRETQDIADKLKHANYDSEALHGDISQSMRTKIMAKFKNKKISLLVATDVAARGIDVSDLTHIINYSMPDKNEIYTHRTGRTGRANKSGVAMSIIGPRDVSKIRRLESFIDKDIEHKKIPSSRDILQKQIDNFITEIKTTDTADIDGTDYFSEVLHKLSKVSKEELVKYFVAKKLNSLANGSSSGRDLNASPGGFDSSHNTVGKNRNRNGRSRSGGAKHRSGGFHQRSNGRGKGFPKSRRGQGRAR